MNRSSSPWLKAGLVTFSVSVAGAAIMALSYASDVPSPHLSRSSEPIRSAAPSVFPLVSPAPKEITQQMIAERTASCAEMISAKDKLRCLNKRLKMKREFHVQEKGKCDLLGDEILKSQCFVDLGDLSKALRSA